jgi:hypothetical protein
MSFCDHCEGQRFDRAQVLRVLRAVRKDARNKSRGWRRTDEALGLAIKAVRAMDIPHLEHVNELSDEEVVH